MKFLVADDHELFLQGLEFVLKKEYPDAKLVLANDYNEILQVLKQQNDFDLLITDLAMPGGNWLEALQKIHNLSPEMPIIVVSAVFDKEILQKTYNIGVSGYVSKSFPNNIIISAINLVLAGGMYIPPDLVKISSDTTSKQLSDLIKSFDNSQKKPDEEKLLTPRQLEVLQCLADGLSNKQIAYKLGLSEGTIKIHITLLMRALNVSNRVAAVRAGERAGLIKHED
ncbi:MAG: response regulator transcription factor [Alphaproteobacteria bacterium]|nr:response regulator transcription factor [Alphaproteobacteria bacterium]